VFHTFDWAIFATPTVLSELQALFGAPPAGAAAELPRMLARLFQHVGGLPVTERLYDEAERTAAARRMLIEAGRRAARDRLGRDAAEGFAEEPSAVPALGGTLRAIRRVPVNRAAAAELAALPVIDDRLARAIVAERMNRGPFRDAADLVRRIRGIGATNIRALRPWLEFSSGPAAPALALSGDFARDFPALVAALAGAADGAALVTAIDLLATTCAADPHPATKHALIRDFAAEGTGAPAGLMAAEWTGVLWSSSYADAVAALIQAAATRVDVGMFHMTLPAQNARHRRLIEALPAARARGVAVRVLLDQDRDTDPYRSTVINTPARQWLLGQGVECRLDRTDRLFHSKIVLIDDALAIVGSHNWTATSFYQVDDLSLAVRSPALAQALAERFQALWAAAS